MAGLRTFVAVSTFVVATVVCIIFIPNNGTSELIDPFDQEAKKFKDTCNQCTIDVDSQSCARCRLWIKNGYQMYMRVHSAKVQSLDAKPVEEIPNDMVALNVDMNKLGLPAVGPEDGYLKGEELPAHILKESILDYCMSKFPDASEAASQSMCFDTMVDATFGQNEPAHRVLRWDDEEPEGASAEGPVQVPTAAESEPGADVRKLRERMDAMVAALCMNTDSVSFDEERLLCGQLGDHLSEYRDV
mmetsp:Transcript_62210/g.166932  ORF Transcript_62210/g.166932 Transcript_62210/m.166932 type:complete len:245 (-) Transcript_62210:317-1051(-)